MTQAIKERSPHLANFTRSQQQDGFGTRPWLDALRRAGIERFEAVGFPSNKEEEWRQTNVAPIAKIPFVLAQPDRSAHAAVAAENYGFQDEVAAELVFVNGHFWPEKSRLGSLPKSVRVLSLAEALKSDPSLVEQHLARHAPIDRNPFVALNTGFLRDGAFIYFGRNATVEKPIHLVFISTAAREPAVSHPRVLMIADENVEATLVETYVGSGAGPYFTNAVTELIASDNARIDHCRIQQESPEAFHIATMHVELARSAYFTSHAATIGGKLTRNDLNVYLKGDGADATLNGLAVIGGDQHADNHTLLHHGAPNCPSHELYKYVIDGRAMGVFKGKIFVDPIAQKTDSKQTSKSLLLSDDAKMYSQPALQIYADDVKCTHGSTTGPVDEEMVFYLRSRGVGLDAARHLLTYAFAADITRRIKVEPVRRLIEDFMAAQHGLPRDLRITESGHAHDAVAV